jgi:hypothetical protein
MKPSEVVSTAAGRDLIRFGSIRAEIAHFGIVSCGDMTSNMH